MAGMTEIYRDSAGPTQPQDPGARLVRPEGTIITLEQLDGHRGWCTIEGRRGGGRLSSASDGVGDLLFVLSSADRLKLLAEIGHHESRLSELATKLDATVQETAKHLKRLSDARLIEKTSSGPYALTPFGSVAMELIPSFRFLSAHRQYFLNHDISFLPKHLLRRIGDLSDHVYVEHVSNVLAECQHLVLMAQEYFWWLIDYPLPWVHDEKFSEGLSVRGIVPSSISPQGYRQAKALLGETSDVRFAGTVKVGVVVNEKMAGICFPNMEGVVDFGKGFIGYNMTFQRWCRDLFEDLWSSSSKAWPADLQARLRSSATG